MSVKASVLSATKLERSDLTAMYAIFSRYYEGVSWEQFLADLAEKSDVIVLRDATNGRVCGFSTLLVRRFDSDGREVLGVFSGDTILEQSHWGSPALGIQFLAYLWRLKLKHPLTPVYWFLISKGYKTYLLMANNFRTHYPNVARPVPAFEKGLMDRFYTAKFGAAYSSPEGVLRFGDESCRLKSAVAPITDELRREVPRIAFFERANPGWERGEELACVARMTLTMPLTYFIKKVLLRKGRRKGAGRPAANPVVASRAGRVS